jgi:predicted O-linked N-acetylglucosamine transferase (SPINDLY family)
VNTVMIYHEVLYNIIIEFCVHTKLATVMIMSLNETYTKVRKDKSLSDTLPIQNNPEQEYAISLFLSLQSTRVYPKFSGLTTWSEYCKWYRSLCH